MAENRDKGGRKLKGKKWRVFNFLVEVAVESPKIVDEAEAAEDAAEFMSTVARTRGRVHDSFATITRIDEEGPKRPGGFPVKSRSGILPGLAQKPIKAKPPTPKSKSKLNKNKKVRRI